MRSKDGSANSVPLSTLLYESIVDCIKVSNQYEISTLAQSYRVNEGLNCKASYERRIRKWVERKWNTEKVMLDGVDEILEKKMRNIKNKSLA